ncbi:MAG: hypothetical protein IKE94_08820 [Aeriscardovia sp.]|nr:hypothetical protein [Aeriscardovia sp.]
MAERRMLTKKVTDDDNFMALSSSAQALYLHLTMSADDDGFNNQINVCMFKAHASIDDLQSLLEKRYLYQFDNGVIVIKHWRMANALRKDRYTPTVWQEELKMLGLKANGSYTMNGNQMATKWQPDGNQMATQDRLDKVRLDKNNSNKRFTPPTLEEVTAYCRERNNNVDPKRFYDYYTESSWKDSSGKAVKNWKQKVITWENHAGATQKPSNRLPDFENINNHAKPIQPSVTPEEAEAWMQEMLKETEDV